MATLSAAASPFCSPEEDPFLLLESMLRSLQEILLSRRGLPQRRTWIEQPYGEEEITTLEEEVIPAIQQCLASIDEIDQQIEGHGPSPQRSRYIATAASRPPAKPPAWPIQLTPSGENTGIRLGSRLP
jgi:hypothetical protein